MYFRILGLLNIGYYFPFSDESLVIKSHLEFLSIIDLLSISFDNAECGTIGVLEMHIFSMVTIQWSVEHIHVV